MSERVSHWRRVRTDPTAWFDEREVEQGRAYNRPADALRLVRMTFVVVVTVAFVVGHVAPRLLDALDVKGWALQVLVVVVALEGVNVLVGTWFFAWRTLVHDRAWGLSTQSGASFLVDQAKELALGLVITAVLVLPLYAVIRATELWWLFGWLLFSGFTVGFGLLWPVLIAPIFNTFTPLEDEALAGRILAVAEKAGLDISGVLVADASRRSTVGNAYVAGLGRTRRVVVFDTILDWPPEVIEQVVAHELGHWRYAHLRRKLPLLISAQLVTFVAAWRLLRWSWLLDRAGVHSVRDPASLPLLFAVFPLVLAATQLGAAFLSRADERQADAHALEVLEDPDAFQDVFRRLAERNKADVDPPLWKRLTASHPPIPERLAFAEAWEDAGATAD